MKYRKFGRWWTADPENWEELAYTLHNEEPFLSYNPNDKVVTKQEQDLADSWL